MGFLSEPLIKAIASNDHDFILESIKSGGVPAHLVFKFLPANLKTYELSLEAVKQSGSCLMFVPEEHKTKELCLAATVGQPMKELHYMPDLHKDEAFCRLMIEEDGENISAIPIERKTYELCLAAIKNSKGCTSLILANYIPEEHKTKELCDAALELDPFCAEFFPDAVKKELNCGTIADFNAAHNEPRPILNA